MPQYRRMIDADELSDFFFSPESGTEEVISDLMSKHGLDYANDVDEDAVRAFAKDLIKGVRNIIESFAKEAEDGQEDT